MLKEGERASFDLDHGPVSSVAMQSTARREIKA
jgi:hypothetical protein